MKWRLSISHIFFCPSGTQTLLESPLTNFTLGLLNGVISQNPQSAVKMDLLPLFITFLICSLRDVGRKIWTLKLTLLEKYSLLQFNVDESEAM